MPRPFRIVSELNCVLHERESGVLHQASPIVWGRNKQISGMKDTRHTETIKAIMKGIIPLTTCIKLLPVVAQAVNRFRPKGGVTMPTIRARQKIMDKCRSFSPS